MERTSDADQPWNFASLRPCGFALQPRVFASASKLTLSSEHFHVSYPVGLARVEIEAVLRTLEAARLDMFARTGPASLSLPDTAIEVVIHETTQDFIAATGQSWWVAGITHGRQIELQPLNVLRRRRILTSTLRHEYTHAAIEVIGQGRTPRWLAEGLAIAFAGEGPSLVRFRPKRQLPVDELERRLASPRSAAEMRSLYASVYVAVRALIQKEGEPAVWRRLKPQPQGAHSVSDKSDARPNLFTA
jgi:hypothetical protein